MKYVERFNAKGKDINIQQQTLKTKNNSGRYFYQEIMVAAGRPAVGVGSVMASYRSITSSC